MKEKEREIERKKGGNVQETDVLCCQCIEKARLLYGLKRERERQRKRGR